MGQAASVFVHLTGSKIWHSLALSKHGGGTHSPRLPCSGVFHYGLTSSSAEWYQVVEKKHCFSAVGMVPGLQALGVDTGWAAGSSMKLVEYSHPYWPPVNRALHPLCVFFSSQALIFAKFLLT